MARFNRRAVLGPYETQLNVSGDGVAVGFVTDPESEGLVGMRALAAVPFSSLLTWQGHQYAQPTADQHNTTLTPVAEQLRTEWE
jgi:hypothetical protein